MVEKQTQSEEGNNQTSSFECRKWVFTLNNYTESDPETIKTYLDAKADKFVFGKEICPTTGTPHLQGYMEFKNSKKWSTIVSSCAPFKRANSRKAKGDLKANYDYTTKEQRGVYLGGFSPEKITYKVNIDLYDWQKEICEKLNEKPDDRTINWIWESKGGIGKTTFQKYVFQNFKNVCILSGKGSDMKHGIVSFMEKHGETPDIVLINIPRSSSGFVSWTGIEEIKDMFFYSGKYEGGQVCGMPPHVYVFANTGPPEETFSSDRLNVMDLNEEKDDDLE